MKRLAMRSLEDWLSSTLRKPLVLRGPRQVGKTWLVREFAKLAGKQLVEINFERKPEYIPLFSSNDPSQILKYLSAAMNLSISIENSLLFLDEIQAFPEMLSKLRWFYEELPNLPVIAAGSLLEFVLGDHTFSMPVGRLEYMHLEPMSFEEFMIAKAQDSLLSFIKTYTIAKNKTDLIPDPVHQLLNDLFQEYLLVGGMPAAVKTWIEKNDFNRVNQEQHNLLSTYRDDFAKYSGRLDVTVLDQVMMSIPRMLGQKYVYSHVNPDLPHMSVKKALSLLNKARITHPVTATAANGIPLGSEIKPKYFKEIFLDVGLVSTTLGLNINDLKSIRDINLINKGGISEQVVGQLLRTISPYYVEPILYYWLRAEANSNAEVDYVIEFGNRIIPIEVKSGSTGSLKSLHVLMELKKWDFAIRINSEVPSLTAVKIKTALNNSLQYQLLSLPGYLISELPRLITSF